MPAPTTDAPLQLVWFRRDLRIDDNPALAAAADRGRVACCFVLDPRIFRGPGAAGVRVRFMLQGLEDLNRRLRAIGGGLHLRQGTSERELARLASELGAGAVHACADDEPFARKRDERAAGLLAAHGIGLTLHHDQTAVPTTSSALPPAPPIAATRPTHGRPGVSSARMRRPRSTSAGAWPRLRRSPSCRGSRTCASRLRRRTTSWGATPLR